MLTSELSSGYLEDRGYKFVKVKTLDPCGRLRSRTYPVGMLDELTEKGFRVDASSIGYAETEKSDGEVRLLEKPNIILPQYKTAIFLGEVYDDGKPVPSFGRNVLKKVVESLPYRTMVGAELEFYLTTADRKQLDNAVYMASEPEDTCEDFKENFLLLAEDSDSGFGIRTMHPEVDGSHQEIEATGGDPVAVMDKMLMLKHLLEYYAKKQGIRATTMPKPFYEQAGSGFHLHLSFWEDGSNLFYGTEQEISEAAKKAAAGILKHSAENAIFTNNSINSYKRLIPGHEAPINPVWGYENRTAMIRIPKPNVLTKTNTRLEIRNPDFCCDPYLSAAAVISAAHIGLSKDYEPIEAFGGNADNIPESDIIKMGLKPFPKNLDDAIALAAAEDAMAKSLYPDLSRLLKIKGKESKDYKQWLGKRKHDLRITEWELDKYFDL